MLTKELLAILCCPQCKGDLRYDQEKSNLTCGVCGAVYEVRDDVPIMVVKDDPRRAEG